MLFGYDNGRKLVSETRFCLSPRSQKRSSSAPIFINSFFGTRNPHGSNRYFKLTFRDPVERRLNPVFEECILHILERFARYREEVLKEMKNPILSSVQIGNEPDGQIDIVLSNKEIPDYKDWDDCYVDDGLYVYTRAKNESYLQKVFAERFDELFNGDDK